MKRFAILVAGCLLAFAATASAGDYHTGASLVCSDCHVAHYSQSHNYSGSAFPFVPLGAGGPLRLAKLIDVADVWWDRERAGPPTPHEPPVDEHAVPPHVGERASIPIRSLDIRLELNPCASRHEHRERIAISSRHAHG